MADADQEGSGGEDGEGDAGVDREHRFPVGGVGRLIGEPHPPTIPP
jgi:hypothetical protein